MGRLLEQQAELKSSRSQASCTQDENERLSTILQELREVRNSLLINSINPLLVWHRKCIPVFTVWTDLVFKSFSVSPSVSLSVMRCWSRREAGWVKRSGSINLERPDYCKTTPNWRRRTSRCRNWCPRSSRTRWKHSQLPLYTDTVLVSNLEPLHTFPLKKRF